MLKIPEGIIPPLVVPFTETEALDENKFRKEVQFFLTHKVAGLSTGGSTGEGAILSDKELVRCIEIVMEEKPDDLPLISGVIRNSVKETVKAGREAKAVGSDVLLITPPFYYGGTAEGNYTYYKEIAKAVSLPIIIYNVVPTNTIQPEEFMELLKIDEIIGVKQVNPILHAETASLYGDKLEAYTYSACDFLLYSTYVSGSNGAISALATIAPELCIKQWNAYLSGEQKKAAEIQQKLLPVVRCYQKKPFPGRVKALINLQGRDVGIGRLPNIMPDDNELIQMKEALKKAGLL